MTQPLTITGAKALRDGVDALLALEPRFGPLRELVGEPPLRLTRPGLQALLRIVTEQSISLGASAAVWSRLESAFDPDSPEAVLAAPVARLRRLGLTATKARAFHAAARAARDGLLRDLVDRDDGDARKALTALPGIGPWTAEIYLLSCLARADAWPAGDVALQGAAGHVFGIAPRPGERQMIALAQPWRPWRSVAARLLWVFARRPAGTG